MGILHETVEKQMALQLASGSKDLNPQQVQSNKILSTKLSKVFYLWYCFFWYGLCDRKICIVRMKISYKFRV